MSEQAVSTRAIEGVGIHEREDLRLKIVGEAVFGGLAKLASAQGGDKVLHALLATCATGCLDRDTAEHARKMATLRFMACDGASDETIDERTRDRLNDKVYDYVMGTSNPRWRDAETDLSEIVEQAAEIERFAAELGLN